VTALAKDDATATLSDRLDVLALAINDVPRYGLWEEDLAWIDLICFHRSYLCGRLSQYVNGMFYTAL